jgi:phage terminase small subunit
MGRAVGQSFKNAKGDAGLPPLHRLFALEVLGGASAAAAYRTVYPRASEKTAETNGPRLLRSAQVARFVNERRAKLLAKAELTAEVKLERILLELHRILAVDPLDIWTDTLTLKPLAEIVPDVRRAISSMKVAEIWEGQGENRKLVGYLREVKFNAKTEASQQLLRVLGAFKDKLEVVEKPYHELVAEAARRRREAQAGGQP